MTRSNISLKLFSIWYWRGALNSKIRTFLCHPSIRLKLNDSSIWVSVNMNLLPIFFWTIFLAMSEVILTAYVTNSLIKKSTKTCWYTQAMIQKHRSHSLHLFVPVILQCLVFMCAPAVPTNNLYSKSSDFRSSWWRDKICYQREMVNAKSKVVCQLRLWSSL